MSDIPFPGLEIVWDADLPPNTGYLVPPLIFAIMQQAEMILGRRLTPDEVASCIAHRSAKLVLEGA